MHWNINKNTLNENTDKTLSCENPIKPGLKNSTRLIALGNMELHGATRFSISGYPKGNLKIPNFLQFSLIFWLYLYLGQLVFKGGQYQISGQVAHWATRFLHVLLSPVSLDPPHIRHIKIPDIVLFILCTYLWYAGWIVNSAPPEQNGCHFADDIFMCIFLKENVKISIKISLKFVTEGPIDNNISLVSIMAWRWIGNKPLSEAMRIRFIDAYMWH